MPAYFVIQQKMESAMQNGDMTMKIKGDKIRVDMTACHGKHEHDHGFRRR